jgi:hypothetical protein
MADVRPDEVSAILKEQLSESDKSEMDSLKNFPSSSTTHLTQNKYVELDNDDENYEHRTLVPFRYNENKKNVSKNSKKNDILKTGLIYGLLAAGGLIGAYSAINNSNHLE